MGRLDHRSLVARRPTYTAKRRFQLLLAAASVRFTRPRVCPPVSYTVVVVVVVETFGKLLGVRLGFAYESTRRPSVIGGRGVVRLWFAFNER